MNASILLFFLAMLFSSTSCENSENCSNGIDDDNDGTIDCYDSDCSGHSDCTEVCGSGKDEDLDSLIDCMDPECHNHTFCVDERCGNGSLDSGEQCDKALPISSSCEDLGFHSGTLTCTSDCKHNTSSCGGYCGDGIKQPTEECDEGYENSNDSEALCDMDCILPKCGDGVVNPGEECDEGGNNLNTPNAACRPNCVLPHCGDSILDDGEECDEGTDNSNSIPDRCRANCTLPICGDAIIDSDEECELTNLNGASCLTFGYYGGDLTCTLCEFSTSDCEAHGFCGDNIAQTAQGELCDGDHIPTGSCADEGFWHGSISCNSNCQNLVTSQCAIAVEISGGSYHTCMVDSLGIGYCWGYNMYGELGNGSALAATSPSPVTGGHSWLTIKASMDFSCGISTSGSLYCWGKNDYNQLGNTPLTESATPLLISPGPYTKLALGSYHGCALKTNGKVECWGHNGWYQLGTNSTTCHPCPQPIEVTSLASATMISSGGHFNCALDTSGNAWCWGLDQQGALGAGTASPPSGRSTTPLPVADGHQFVTITSGHGHTCGITTTGETWCWGTNFEGLLGNDATSFSRFPMLISGNHNFAEIDAGNVHNCAVDLSGASWCWGFNSGYTFGQGVNPISSHIPLQSTTSEQFITITGGRSHTCAITVSGHVMCWGRGYQGQLGTGDSISYQIPWDVLPP